MVTITLVSEVKNRFAPMTWTIEGDDFDAIKDAVKATGARFDSGKRAWYVTADQRKALEAQGYTPQPADLMCYDVLVDERPALNIKNYVVYLMVNDSTQSKIGHVTFHTTGKFATEETANMTRADIHAKVQLWNKTFASLCRAEMKAAGVQVITEEIYWRAAKQLTDKLSAKYDFSRN